MRENGGKEWFAVYLPAPGEGLREGRKIVLAEDAEDAARRAVTSFLDPVHTDVLPVPGIRIGVSKRDGRPDPVEIELRTEWMDEALRTKEADRGRRRAACLIQIPCTMPRCVHKTLAASSMEAAALALAQHGTMRQHPQPKDDMTLTVIAARVDAGEVIVKTARHLIGRVLEYSSRNGS